MICVTGFEDSTQQLLKRVEAHKDQPLHEVRLDALKTPLPSADAFSINPKRLIVTCREKKDGGFFQGSVSDHIAELSKGIKLKPGWIDIEADLPDEAAYKIIQEAKENEVKVLRSLHYIESVEPGLITKALAFLDTLEGHGIKLAAMVDDAALLQEFLPAPSRRPAVLIGMGPAGIASRILSSAFCSAWTYVSAAPLPGPNTGLMDINTAKALNAPADADASIFTLIGGPSITGSPGPAVYNRLFRDHGFKAVYLPIITKQLDTTFGLLCRLGFKGASITIPHKINASRIADELGYSADAVKTVNTLFLTDEGNWRGENTDISGIRSLAQKRSRSRLKDGVIIGNGGFARACAYALAEENAVVSLLSRTLIPEEGPWAASLPISAIDHLKFDIIINATPVGSHPDDPSIVPEHINLANKVVIDGVLAKKPTKLIRHAQKQGALAISGVEVWAEQGAMQMKFFKGPDVTPQVLCSLATELTGLSPAYYEGEGP